MTYDELKTMERETITPAVAAQFLSCDPHAIRLIARQHPERLGFPVVCYGNRVKIPRRAFIKFLEGEI
jgi:hypothetical protein